MRRAKRLLIFILVVLFSLVNKPRNYDILVTLFAKHIEGFCTNTYDLLKLAQQPIYHCVNEALVAAKEKKPYDFIVDTINHILNRKYEESFPKDFLFNGLAGLIYPELQNDNGEIKRATTFMKNVLNEATKRFNASQTILKERTAEEEAKTKEKISAETSLVNKQEELEAKKLAIEENQTKIPQLIHSIQYNEGLMSQTKKRLAEREEALQKMLSEVTVSDVELQETTLQQEDETQKSTDNAACDEDDEKESVEDASTSPADELRKEIEKITNELKQLENTIIRFANEKEAAISAISNDTYRIEELKEQIIQDEESFKLIIKEAEQTAENTKTAKENFEKVNEHREVIKNNIGQLFIEAYQAAHAEQNVFSDKAENETDHLGETLKKTLYEMSSIASAFNNVKDADGLFYTMTFRSYLKTLKGQNPTVRPENGGNMLGNKPFENIPDLKMLEATLESLKYLDQSVNP